MDRGSLDFTWFGQLTSQGVFFVTRPKHNTAHAVVEAPPVVERSLIVADEVISLAAQAQPHCPALRHQIEVVVPQSGELLTLLTSHLTFAAITVAAIYKGCGQIAPLIPRYLPLRARFGWWLSNLAALLRMNLFVHRDLWRWLDQPFQPPPELPQAVETAFAFAQFGQQLQKPGHRNAPNLDNQALAHPTPANLDNRDFQYLTASI